MKHNAINLYKHFEEMSKNPKGSDSLERENVRRNAIRSLNNMKEHFMKSRKYSNDPEIQALLGKKEEVKQEKKEDGKKSKR